MNVSTDAVQNLMEVGYVAAGRGLLTHSELIVLGVQAARPESEVPAIGRALARMNAQQPASAAEVLREALKKRPDADILKSFLGLALQQAGRADESKKLLEEVVAGKRDPQAAAMADAILHPRDE